MQIQTTFHYCLGAKNMAILEIILKKNFVLSLCLGFLLILLIESVVDSLFGGHGHSHFPSQESLEVSYVEANMCGLQKSLSIKIMISQTENS